MTRKDQKKTERIYLEKFLECIRYNPEHIEEQENPDFIITIESKRIGVEVTEFHFKDGKALPYTRRQVEEMWNELQTDLMNEIKNKTLKVFGMLSFKRLELPPLSKYKEFISEVIKYISELTLPQNLRQTYSDFPPDYPLMGKYLRSISLKKVDYFMSWDWNHNAAWGGLVEEELVEKIKSKSEKIKRYETTNLSEMWLLVVSGVKTSQFMGIPEPEALNNYSKCNELLKQLGFDKVYIYQYMQNRILEWYGDWKIIKEKN